MPASYDDEGEFVDEDAVEPATFDDYDPLTSALPSSSTFTGRAFAVFNSPQISVGGRQLTLVSTSQLLLAHQRVFPFPYFNPVQSACFDNAYHSDHPIVVAAPTGAGKTGVLELAVLRLFANVSPRTPSSPKVIYLAPLRALCYERFNQWRALFAPLNLRCLQFTGDTADPPREAFFANDVIITTPEKMDGLSRRRDVMGVILARIGLVCIDEVHLLRENRGACLEGIVARLKLLQHKHRREAEAVESSSSFAAPPPPIVGLRFLALSATVVNVQDIARWLGDDCVPYLFGDEYRPVPMRYHVHAYPPMSNPFHFERSLDTRVVDVLSRYSASPRDAQLRLPSLIFCNTRKATSHTARMLIQETDLRCLSSLLVPSAAHAQELQRLANGLQDGELKTCVRKGVGFHHAGLDVRDRSMVEKAFIASQLLVVCTTTTLALGVNLPAHLVVIKSTQYYQHGKGWVEYDTSAVLQMTGRAGRPQFDDEGIAVVMCSDPQKPLYERLVGGLLPVESTFQSQLIEHLNSEVVTSAIVCMDDALAWMQHTFLYVRCMQNPAHYGLPPTPLTPAQRQTIVEGWLKDSLTKLRAEGCIRVAEGGQLLAAEKGRVMNTHYLSFSTICLFCQLPTSTSLSALLYLFCQASEFADLRCRQGEKAPLYSFLKLSAEQRSTLDPPPLVPFPLPNNAKLITHTADKLYLLVQGVCIGRSISGPTRFNLSQDIDLIFGPGLRVARAMEQFACDAQLSVLVIKASIQLRKSLERRCLGEGDRKMGRLLMQMFGVGPVHGQLLASAGLDSFQRLREASGEQLDAVGKGSKLRVHAALLNIPQYEVRVEQGGEGQPLQVHVKQGSAAFALGKAVEKRGGHQVHLLVGRQHTGQLLVHFRMRLHPGINENSYPIQAATGDRLRFDVVDDYYVGVDVFYKYELVQPADDVLYMGVEDPSARVQASAPMLVEVEDDEAVVVSEVIPAGTTVCQHSLGTCLQSMCQHECCQKRASIMTAKRGTTLDMQLVQQMQSARSKAKAPLPMPKPVPFKPPDPFVRPSSSQAEQPQRRGGGYAMQEEEKKQSAPVQLLMFEADTARWYDEPEQKTSGDVAVVHVRQPVMALRPALPPPGVATMSQRQRPPAQHVNPVAVAHSAAPPGRVIATSRAGQTSFSSDTSSAAASQAEVRGTVSPAARLALVSRSAASKPRAVSADNVFARFQLNTGIAAATVSTPSNSRTADRSAFRGLDKTRIAPTNRLLVDTIEDPQAVGWERSYSRTSPSQWPMTSPSATADRPRSRHDRSRSPPSARGNSRREQRGDGRQEERRREEDQLNRAYDDWDEDRALGYRPAGESQREGFGGRPAGSDGGWTRGDERDYGRSFDGPPPSAQRGERSSICADEEKRGWGGEGGHGVNRWEMDRWQQEDYDRAARHPKEQPRTSPYFHHSHTTAAPTGRRYDDDDDDEDRPLLMQGHASAFTQTHLDAPSSCSHHHQVSHPPLPHMQHAQWDDARRADASLDGAWKAQQQQQQQRLPPPNTLRYSPQPHSSRQLGHSSPASPFSSPALHQPTPYGGRGQWRA